MLVSMLPTLRFTHQTTHACKLFDLLFVTFCTRVHHHKEGVEAIFVFFEGCDKLIGDLITYNRSIAKFDYMYATIFSIVAFAVITVSLLHRLETTIFRPEKRGS